jgi:hypothetical protein
LAQLGEFARVENRFEAGEGSIGVFDEKGVTVAKEESLILLQSKGLNGEEVA